MTTKISGRPRTSTITSAPSAIWWLSRASAIPLRSVGENVPEVTSPSGDVGGERDAACPAGRCRGRPRPVRAAHRAGPALLLGHERVATPERGLLPADGPAEPGLVGGDVEGDVLAVQRVAHLGAQGVARAEAAGQHAVRLPRRQQRVPQAGGDLVARDQLVAPLAGVAGAADHDGSPSCGASTNDMYVVAGRQPDRVEHLVGLRALHREHGVGRVVVGDRDAVGRLAPRAGGPPRRCWPRWAPAARGRRRGGRRSGRRRCRRSRRRSTGCTAPCRARSCRGRCSGWR